MFSLSLYIYVFLFPLISPSFLHFSLFPSDIHAGQWYDVTQHGGVSSIARNATLLAYPEPTICAFDIEVTKDPLKFPDVEKDEVMMISFVLNGDGFLIVNRETVSKDIEDFDFAPEGKFPTRFTIFNERNEEDTLRRFISEAHAEKVALFVTYNGDAFDWPYVAARAARYGLSIEAEFGLRANSAGEFVGTDCAHLDCFR